MNVRINDASLELPDGSTLSQAIKTKGVPTEGIATAVNGTVIPAAARDSHVLTDGDNIVIIKAFYGG